MPRGKPFEKGKSGNPAGRPKKGMALTEILKEKIDAGTLADKLIKMAESGDFQAIKYIYDRVDGTAVQTVNQTIIEHSNPILSALREIIDGPQPETDRLSTDEQS